jgi:hypothetical protein
LLHQTVVFGNLAEDWMRRIGALVKPVQKAVVYTVQLYDCEFECKRGRTVRRTYR